MEGTKEHMLTYGRSDHLENDKYSSGAKHTELKSFIMKEEVQKTKSVKEVNSTNVNEVLFLTEKYSLKPFPLERRESRKEKSKEEKP
ncbi:hypothetical protein CR513_34464, partial [Mucuna pruriens]